VSGTLDLLQRALDFVEADLFAPLPLAAIAERGGYSPWHFHRTFTALTGVTPATYVWKRRLSEICRRLVETDQPIVDLALDCGFESQATFTRAFTRQVGVSPGRFRRTRRFVVSAYLYPRLDLVALVAQQHHIDFIEPRIVRKPAFRVVGMVRCFTSATTGQIPELWAGFLPRAGEVTRRRGYSTFGVCVGAKPATADEPAFTYLAGVEATSGARVPDGMTAIKLRGGNYAVFTHTGHVSRLNDTVKKIWGRWLPRSRYEHVPAPDFELYDPDRWDPATGEGEIDLYIPVAHR
jgi:AraC family transcriptional regulator